MLTSIMTPTSALVPFLAEVPEGMNSFQKISLFLGMMILTYTAIRIGMRRKRLLAAGASGQPSPRQSFTEAPVRERHTGRGGLFGGGAPMSSGGAELEGLVVSLREAGREIEARLDTKIRYAQRLMEEAQQTLTELEVARARAEAAARGVPMEDPTATHRAELAAAESSLARARELERAQAEERAARERREEDERKKGKPRSFFAPVDELEDGEPGDENATLRDSGETRQGDPEGPNNGRAATRSDDRNADRARARDEGQDRDPRRDPDRERQQLSDVTRGLEPTAETESQRRVRELAEEGKSAREIAREVQRPVGEIELILALGRSDGPR